MIKLKGRESLIRVNWSMDDHSWIIQLGCGWSYIALLIYIIIFVEYGLFGYPNQRMLEYKPKPFNC
jgi:hypothetical protein